MNYYYNYHNLWGDEEKRQRMLDWNFNITEQEPLWDAADAAHPGKDIFWQASSVTNRAGMDWLQRYFGAKGIRIHPIMFDYQDDFHPWHIDVCLTLVRPGLAIYSPHSGILTEEAKKLFEINDWELIEAAEPTYYYENTVNLLGVEYEGPSIISMNTFSLGPNTICVEAKELKYIDQLTKLGIEVVEVPYEAVVPFGGMLHCTTLDVYREGECEDYFPKQVPGY